MRYELRCDYPITNYSIVDTSKETAVSSNLYPVLCYVASRDTAELIVAALNSYVESKVNE